MNNLILGIVIGSVISPVIIVLALRLYANWCEWCRTFKCISNHYD